jgi:hypothetical protein
MDFLYHASGYKQEELMPGFKRSGKHVKWDVTESNDWLYATIDRAEAISMAFAAGVEKKAKVARYKTAGKNIDVTLRSGHAPSHGDLHEIEIYLYTIHYDPKDGWIPVNNNHNGLIGEYKTRQTIEKNIESRVQIDVADFLKNKQLNFSMESMPAWANW